MKQLVGLVIALFFIGCSGVSSSGGKSTGSSGDSTSGSSLNSTDDTPDFDDFKYQQWYLETNEWFYAKYDVNPDAHIHPNENTYYTYTGKNSVTDQRVRVAIIDEGFDTSHPELSDNIIASYTFDEDGNHTSGISKSISSNHGTAVSGIIAASDQIQGIARDVELILIQMPELISDDTVVAMFEKAIQEGAELINCSWGYEDNNLDVTQYLRDEINGFVEGNSSNDGVNIIFASGNDDIKFTKAFASIKNVITVGATNKHNLRTDYSNYGEELDIVAPGGEELGISTLDISGFFGATTDDYIEFDDYGSFTGTSAAAPIVTGALALLLDKYNKDSNNADDLNATQINEKIKTATDHIGDEEPYLDDMIVSNVLAPTITGILGTNGDTQLQILFRNYDNDGTYGPYDLTTIYGDNGFQAIISNDLIEGNYAIDLVDKDDNTKVYATDQNFEINTSAITNYNSDIKQSNYYGYGKLNLSKLLE